MSSTKITYCLILYQLSHQEEKKIALPKITCVKLIYICPQTCQLAWTLQKIHIHVWFLAE
jgi:hypothetical protein